jgi:hypothetical protein
MITPLIAPEILLDIYHNKRYLYTVNQFTFIDLRVQIAEKELEGYSAKINPEFWTLFETEDDIANEEVIITKDGWIEDWFSNYSINEDYNDVPVFSDTLIGVCKIRSIQIKREKENK